MIVSLLEKIKAELAKYAESPHGGIDGLVELKLDKGNYEVYIMKDASKLDTSEWKYLAGFSDSGRSKQILDVAIPTNAKGIHISGIPKDTYYYILNAQHTGMSATWGLYINAIAESSSRHIAIASDRTPGFVVLNA